MSFTILSCLRVETLKNTYMAYVFHSKFSICVLFYLIKQLLIIKRGRKGGSDYKPRWKMQKRPDFFLAVFQLLLVLSAVQLPSVSANIKYIMSGGINHFRMQIFLVNTSIIWVQTFLSSTVLKCFLKLSIKLDVNNMGFGKIFYKSLILSCMYMCVYTGM